MGFTPRRYSPANRSIFLLFLFEVPFPSEIKANLIIIIIIIVIIIIIIVIMIIIIRESYYDRDSKDLHAGICANPQKGAQCMNRMIDLSD